jgi:hypothetical protein
VRSFKCAAVTLSGRPAPGTFRKAHYIGHNRRERLAGTNLAALESTVRFAIPGADFQTYTSL